MWDRDLPETQARLSLAQMPHPSGDWFARGHKLGTGVLGNKVRFHSRAGALMTTGTGAGRSSREAACGSASGEKWLWWQLFVQGTLAWLWAFSSSNGC